MKNLLIYSRDASIYAECFERLQSNQVNLLYAGLAPQPKTLVVTDIVLGEPDLISSIIAKHNNIQWVQSSWAGNNKLQNTPYHEYMLTGVKGVFASQMSEYVLAYMLYFQRNIEHFLALKHAKQWLQLPSQALQDKTVGIMGMGSIGQAVAKTLSGFGMQVRGLVSQSKQSKKMALFTSGQLSEFVQPCDYLVNLLPETKDTMGMCNEKFFADMKKGSIFINVGRGTVIDRPETLVNALESKHLSAAVLDVFEEEPLPASHIYFDTDNLHLSCHTAAVSDPKQVFAVFEENLDRFLNKQALLYQHDFSKGY